MKTLSQTALYGEVLTSEQQYSLEVNKLSPLNNEQKEDLAQKAKAGDIQAGHELVYEMLPSVLRLARRYARVARHSDVGDFCQVASLEMLEALPRALEKKGMCAYLYGVARSAMLEHLHMFDDLISKKSHDDYSKESYTVESLDIPLVQGNDETWEDFIQAPALLLENEQETGTRYEPLYQEIEALSEKQRVVILRYFGLGDVPQASPMEIEKDLTGKEKRGDGQCPVTTSRKIRAYKKLRQTLEATYACA